MCAQCAAEFATPAELMRHRRTAHRDKDPATSIDLNPEAHTAGVVGALCGRRFRNAGALATHNLRPHVHDAEIRAPQATGG